MLNSENKTYDLKKIIPVMFCRFSIDLSALKKCPILHIENLTSKKKKIGYQDYNEYSADKFNIAYIFEM